MTRPVWEQGRDLRDLLKWYVLLSEVWRFGRQSQS